MKKLFLLFTALLLSVVSAGAAKKFVPLTSDNINQVVTGTRCIFVRTTPANYGIPEMGGKTFIMASEVNNDALDGIELPAANKNADGSITPTADSFIGSITITTSNTWKFYQWTESGVFTNLLNRPSGTKIALSAATSYNEWNVSVDTDGSTIVKLNEATRYIQNYCGTVSPYQNHFGGATISDYKQGLYGNPTLYVEMEVAGDPEPVVGDGNLSNPYRITSIDQIKTPVSLNTYYLYTGELVVTYVVPGGQYGSNGMYAQTTDGSEGILFFAQNDIGQFTKDLKVGDVISNLLFTPRSDQVASDHQVNLYYNEKGNFGIDAEHPEWGGAFDKGDNIAVEPKLVDLTNRPQWPINTLVKVENVTFNPTTGVLKDNHGLIQDGRPESDVVCTWSNAELSDTEVPTVACDITGIVAYANMIYPRTAADIEELAAPVLEPDGSLERPYPITSFSEIDKNNVYYLFKGESVITYSYLDTLYEVTYPQFASNSSSCLFMQNNEGAAQILTKNIKGLAAKLTAGDKVTSMLLQRNGQGQILLYENPNAEFENALTIVEKNVAVEPVLIKLSEIAQYKGYLVRLDDLTVVDPAGKTFDSGQSKFLKLKQGDTEKAMALGTFTGLTNVIGKPAPMGVFNITAALCDGTYLRITDYAAIQEVAVITLSTDAIDLSKDTAPYTKEVTVSGTALKGDITLELPETITANPSVVTKEAAEAEGGCVVTLTINPGEVENYEAKVTFKSEGANDVVLTLSANEIQFAPNGTLAHPYPVEKLSEIKNNTTEYSIYTGNLVVTYIDESGKSFYAQTEDNTEACRIYTTYAADLEKKLAVGDKISNMIVKVYNLDNNRFYAYPNAKGNFESMLDRVAQNVVITPKVVTLDNLGGRNFLVKLEKVTATNATEGEKFTSNTSLDLKQGEISESGVLVVFTGSSVIDNDVPLTAFNLTGIRDFSKGVYPRTMADIDVLPVVKPSFTFYSKPTATGNFIQRPAASPTTFSNINGVAPRKIYAGFKVDNPSGDVTIECPSIVTADKTTFTLDELKGGICPVELTITPETSGDYETSVTFKTEGAEVVLTIKGNLTLIKEVTSLADVKEKSGYFFVKDTEVTVSYVTELDAYANASYAYIQNETDAMRLVMPMTPPAGNKELKPGVTFKNFWIFSKQAASGEWVYNLQGSNDDNTSYGDKFIYDVVATDTELTPKEVTVAEIDANANRLVKLANVEFQNVTEGQAFSKTMTDIGGGNVYPFATAYDVKVGDAEAKVEPFVDSNVYGNSIPTKAVDVVGIAATGNIVMPRAMTDITEAAEEVKPTVTLSKAEVSLTAKVDETATETITLTMKDCTKAVTITAKNADVTTITLDKMSIEPSAEPADLVITFAPTAEGEVEQEFEITTEGMAEAVVLKVKGTAVAKEVVLPTITLSKTDVDLSAKVGDQATEKITLTMKDCTKAIEIKAKNDDVKAITLGAMSIEPSEEPVELVITFAPTTDGVVEQEFEITTEGMTTPVVLKVKGTGVSFVAMIAADAEGMYRVYNVNGILLMETKNAQDLHSLASGLYIINGRKYMVRK